MAVFVVGRMRPNLRRDRIFRDRRNPLDFMDDDELYKAYRFRRHELLMICDEVADDLTFDAPRKGSLLPIMQVISIIFFSMS